MSKKTQVHVPEIKKNIVNELVDKIKKSKTVLISSTKSLPGSQFHQIKKKMRDHAEVKVAKKSLILRAIDESKCEGIEKLKENVQANVAFFFSDLDAFELSASLTDNQTPAPAKEGDLAPEDIQIEPGPTSLVPGPAISELGSVGIKVAVEGGKLAVKQQTTVAHKGDTIDSKLASVLAKLGILPMKVGFEPIAAYDSVSHKVYVGIKIDKKQAYEDLQTAIGKSLSFAVNIKYPTAKTIAVFIAKAGIEEKALTALIESKSSSSVQEAQPEEKSSESEKSSSTELNDQTTTKEDK